MTTTDTEVVEDVSHVRPEQRLYRPYGGALELFYCKEPEILIEGPAGTGKTRAVLEKVHLIMQKYPGARALLCRKTRASMTQSVLVTFEEKVLVKGDRMKFGAGRANRHAYKYRNGSELVIGGLDNPDRIMSTEFDVIAVFEATEATVDDVEQLGSRMRNGVVPYQSLMMDCNPGAPSHWLNRRCFDGLTKRILSRHSDNPAVDQVYLARLARTLTGARRERLFEGKWAAQEGLVYSVYDPAVHLINRFEIPADWRRVRVIDFGFRNAFVCQWWACDPDGRWFRYREIYMTNRTVRQHAKQIRALSVGERIETTIADHDAEDIATLTEEGIPSMLAVKDVKRGIEQVQDMLAVQSDDRPRMYFLRDSLVEVDPYLAEEKLPYCTEQEFESYVWPKGQDGRPDKEAPVKDHDHGLDCTRYVAMFSTMRRYEFQ